MNPSATRCLLCALLLLRTALSPFAAAHLRPRHWRSVLDVAAPTISLETEGSATFVRTPLAAAIEATGSIEATAATAVADTRPLKIEFLFVSIDEQRSDAEVEFLRDTMLPAAASVLARSIRVQLPHLSMHAGFQQSR